MPISAWKSSHADITNEEEKEGINGSLDYRALNLRNLFISAVGTSMFTYNKETRVQRHPCLLHLVWQPWQDGWQLRAHTQNQKDVPQVIFPCSLRVHTQAVSGDLIKKNVCLHTDGGPWQDSPARWEANEGNESSCQQLKVLVWCSPSAEWNSGPENPR